MRELNERLDELVHIVEQDSFFTQRSLGGELNFHIFDYDPKDELTIRSFITNFIKKYDYENSKIRPIEIDLFEIMLEILESKKVGEKNILDLSIQKEEKEGSDRVLKALSSMLKPETFANIIKEKSQDKNLIILSGVGKIYPLLRSHIILNNLHSVINDKSLLLFYPGQYDQQQLVLFKSSKFDGIKDDNYYRAFQIAH